MLDDVCMKCEGHITDLHGKVLCTAEGPVSCAVSSFHLKTDAGIDMGSHFFCQIFSDGDDLGAWVDNTGLCFTATDQNVDFLEGNRILGLWREGGLCDVLLKGSCLDTARA